MREVLIRNGRIIMQSVDGHVPPCPAISVTSPRTTPRRTSLDDVRRFGNMVYNAARSGKALVDQAEAERRAAICRGCPKNVPIEGCSVCKAMVRKIAEYIGTRTVTNCNELQGCDVCGCELKVAVWVDLAVQQAGIDPATNTKFPETCWKRRP